MDSSRLRAREATRAGRTPRHQTRIIGPNPIVTRSGLPRSAFFNSLLGHCVQRETVSSVAKRLSAALRCVAQKGSSPVPRRIQRHIQSGLCLAFRFAVVEHGWRGSCRGGIIM